jgi:hypothetical protein
VFANQKIFYHIERDHELDEINGLSLFQNMKTHLTEEKNSMTTFLELG